MKAKDNLCCTYRQATGPVQFNMTNDYMFRAVNHKNPNVTKGIICAVLHLNPESIQSVEITNPIELGESIDDKTFMLDINVLLNNSSMINLEMQVVNEHNWQERSLSYLCRSFDQLYQGETWEEIIMIAEKNPYIAEAAQSLYESHADEVTEMQCRVRRDYYKQKNTTEKIMRELTTENTALNKENAQLHARIEELEAQLAKQTSN